MKYPSLKFIDKLNVKTLHDEELACYAYALTFCQYPASVVSGEWYQMVDDICSRKIADLRAEIIRRLEVGEKAVELANALAVIDDGADLVNDNDSRDFSQDLAKLSQRELLVLYSMSEIRNEMRRRDGMELFTRSYQWRIVNEMLRRKGHGVLARILKLTEFIEADNYAHNLGMAYKIGESVKSFTASDYATDEEICSRIYALSRKADYVSREELIQIADYIQTEIVEKGETPKHKDLVKAILSTGILCLDYPRIVKDFERVTKSSAKKKQKKRESVGTANYIAF